MNEKTDIPVAASDKAGLAARIRQAMGERSQREFARLIGIGHATLNQYLMGSTEPSWSTLIAIAREGDVPIFWLMTGEGGLAERDVPKLAPDNHVEISRFAIRASAGTGEKVFDEPPASFWQVPRAMLRGFSGNPKHLASIDASGDSMVPTLHDGDPVIFDRSSRQVDREGVYVLTVGDDLFVKRVRRVPQADGSVALELISDNPAYDSIALAADAQEHVRVHGRVIWPNTSRR